MPGTIALKCFEEHHNCFDLIYDSYRLVDPECKEVIEYHDYTLHETGEKCYARWGKSQPCENCISYYSNRSGKSTVKLISTSSCILMVTALPIEDGERTIVLELMKDVTDSMIYDFDNNPDCTHILDAVSKLNSMVTKDHLTSLYNRRYIDDRLPLDIKNAVAKKSPLSVIFLDVDNFKSINDTYGHDVGDLVLKAAAGALAASIRNGADWAARYGGDEFVVCLNGTDAEAAKVVAERILYSIANISIPTDKGSINITVSIGMHTMSKQVLTAQEIIKLADQNMYDSKHSGKNCISCSIE